MVIHSWRLLARLLVPSGLIFLTGSVTCPLPAAWAPAFPEAGHMFRFVVGCGLCVDQCPVVQYRKLNCRNPRRCCVSDEKENKKLGSQFNSFMLALRGLFLVGGHTRGRRERRTRTGKFRLENQKVFFSLCSNWTEWR